MELTITAQDLIRDNAHRCTLADKITAFVGQILDKAGADPNAVDSVTLMGFVNPTGSAGSYLTGGTPTQRAEAAKAMSVLRGIYVSPEEPKQA